MSISEINTSVASLLTKTPAKTAPDGDSPAVEAAESAATKLAEKQNGGFVSQTSQPATGFSRLV